MSGRPVSLEDVVAGLRSEGRLTDATLVRAGALLAQLDPVQPWYVRAMVGFGAWIASLFVIGGVAGLSMAVGGVTLLGLGLIVSAVALRRKSDNDFTVQASLAASLAGQAMLARGESVRLASDAFFSAASRGSQPHFRAAADSGDAAASRSVAGRAKRFSPDAAEKDADKGGRLAMRPQRFSFHLPSP